MKWFCTDLRKHATEITKYEEKKMLPLTDEEIASCNKNSTKSRKRGFLMLMIG